MEKGAIKNYAVWARRRLIEDVTQKAFEVGVTGGGIADAVRVSSDAVQVNGRLLNKCEARQREALVKRVNEKGFDQVMEEAAYTWFNRIIAIRFMEVNGYLPTGVRVLSSTEAGQAVPDIITNALHLDLGLDLDLVYAYLDKHNDDELFRYLFTRQCNKLNEILPGLFEKIEDYTELLLPNNLLIEGSIIRRLVSDIPEEDFRDQVEIIGWLYQYYISEKKDQVFAALKKNVKITKENIPAATQLFTPAWIVKYMVENSLGRLWLEGHPDEELKSKWKYYLEEADQEPAVQKQLDEIREKSKSIRPEDIKVLDPCMGSGHILVYAFDVLFQIYQSAGYTQRDAVRLIVEKNLYGLDIDDRAYQLAYFAVMMKARKHDRRFLTRGITPNLCAIQESNSLVSFEHGAGQLSLDDLHRETANYLIKVFRDAKEYGSILNIEPRDYDGLLSYIEQLRQNGADDLLMSMWLNNISEVMPALIKQAKIMAQKYDVVVTNPPYMGKGMNAKLSEFVKKNYPDSKSDLFAVFIEKCGAITKADCYQAIITQHSWMFLSSYEKLRVKILIKNIVNMVHLGAKAFEEIGGEVVQTTIFVLRNLSLKDYKAGFVRLVDFGSQQEKEYAFLSKQNLHIVTKENFSKIPGMPIAYWVSENFYKAFKQSKPLGEKFDIKKGMDTGENDKFVRRWFEPSINDIDFKTHSKRWVPYIKGGESRKWYGNYDFVVFWENNGETIKNYHKSNIRNEKYNYLEGITWSDIKSNYISARYMPEGCLRDNLGNAIFNLCDHLKYVLALLCCKVCLELQNILNPTIHFQVGNAKSLPIIFNQSYKERIDRIVEHNIVISRSNWDYFETSWDFKKHNLLIFKDTSNAIEGAFNSWYKFAEKQFNQLKQNEEELNYIFIDIYGLQDELTPEVEDKDITIRKADLVRDIKSFISYAVGCMFGRYSIDTDGLIYAGGDWRDKWQDGKVRKIEKDEEGNIISDTWVKATFLPDEDNVLPILDDEYFDDDIVCRFIQFLRVTFSEETLEENLDFIAGALGRKASETSRQAIRRYFLKDFFKDHVKVYQKRPIYWLFDSGKEDGFKALIYMHRYDEFTVARVRMDYLHRLQRAYEAEARRLEALIESDVSPREKTAARKKREKLLKQMQECLAYDQVIAHVANQRIKINLDDGVKVNYAKFQGIEVPQGDGRKPLKADLLAKI
jgi:type II restriction/modification system DNA methylase subunit YeeA